ncbi:MAG: glycosyltransferase family 2 protein [Cyanobacteria bacterium J06632_3]
MQYLAPRRLASFAKRFAGRNLANAYLQRHTQHLFGDRTLKRKPNDCITIAVVRDCEDYIDTFIRHYLKLGVAHIVLMDNGSEDDTVSRAAQHKNVTAISCKLPYKKFKDEMRQFLADRYSLNRWCITADCDEFLDYPHSAKVSLEQLIRYCENHGYQAVLTQMLDMYPACEIGTQIEPADFRKEHRWFEVDSIKKEIIPAGLENTVGNADLRLHYGGVRQRVFQVSPLISKFALIKPSFDLKPVGHHLISRAKIADISAVLYHYKFISSFSKTVARAVQEKQYYQGSAEYEKYHQSLNSETPLKLLDDSSIELTDISQLLKLNFIRLSNGYENYARSVS